MNGVRKFHSPDGPAFAAGENWFGSSGTRVTVLSTRRYGPDKWDVEVTYLTDEDRTHSKDAWNFQVRYFHQADKNL